MHVESVAWISERKDVLSALFGWLSLIFYVRYARLRSPAENAPSRSLPMAASSSGPTALNYGFAGLWLALGLMSKPMLVTWPFVMLLLDFWPLQRFRISDFGFRILKTLLVEKIPFFALAMASSVVTFLVQKSSGAVAALDTMPLGMRGGNALISCCRYLGKLFWPVNLAVFYPLPAFWPLGWVLLAGMFLAALTMFFWRIRPSHPFCLQGWLWFVGTLVPVIGLVQVGSQAMADRYTYIPSVGLLVLFTWGVSGLLRPWRHQVIALSVAGSALILICVALTRAQLGYWQDSGTLFRHALEHAENNYVAHCNLGDFLDEKGQTDEAMSHYRKAIRLEPGLAQAHYDLGNLFKRTGRIAEAVSQYQEAVRLAPDFADAHNNLGNALFSAGRIDEAVSQYQEAIRLQPDIAAALNGLGNALSSKGELDEAISQYDKAIRLQPDYALARNGLANALYSKGRVDEAINQFREAIRLQPDYVYAYIALGKALGGRGDKEEEIKLFREAIRLHPDFADSHNEFGVALARLGRLDEAIEQLREAIRLKPGYASAHNNLGRSLVRMGRLNEAIVQYQEAIRLQPDDPVAHDNLNRALAMKSTQAGTTTQLPR
jgi:tetratricopeptide (TPR) repeat protein